MCVRKLTAGDAPVRQNTDARIMTDLRIMLLDVTAQGADSMWSLTSSPSVFISGNSYPSIKCNNEFVVTVSRIGQQGITRNQCHSSYRKGLSDMSDESFMYIRVTLRE